MSEIEGRDDIYVDDRTPLAPFTFDEKVADVFPDMIARSVPGYDLILPLIGLITARFAQPDSVCYDLGCSLGAATLSMRQHLTQPGARIIAVDNSPAMVRRLRDHLADQRSPIPVEVIEADILDVPVSLASVVVLNFTFQFIAPSYRRALVQNLYDGMLPGGVLVISEKVAFGDADEDARMVDLHLDFKRANGYSDLEISQKRSALEDVLIPETVVAHRERLLGAGFQAADLWFRCLNFVSMLAIK